MSKSLALLEDPGPGCGAAMAKLTPNQRRFVMALLTLGDLNHSQAAKMAGFPNASVHGSVKVCNAVRIRSRVEKRNMPFPV